MRKLVLPLVFCFLLTASAQNTTDARTMLKQLSQQLDLTTDQKEKLKPILQQEAQQLQVVRDDTSLTQRQRLVKTKGIKDSFQPQVNAVLTPEQQEKLKQLKAEAMERMREKRQAAVTTSQN